MTRSTTTIQSPGTSVPGRTTTTRARAKWRRRLLISFTVAILFWLTASFLIAYKLTHRLSARSAPPPPPTDVPVETISLKTSDGEQLGAWLAKGKPDRPAVLLIHGMTGNRSNHIPL